jgi:hypothetical protein
MPLNPLNHQGPDFVEMPWAESHGLWNAAFSIRAIIAHVLVRADEIKKFRFLRRRNENGSSDAWPSGSTIIPSMRVKGRFPFV